MSLDELYVLLRGIHFVALILTTGIASYAAWLAPPDYRPSLIARWHRLLRGAAWVTLTSAVALLAAQAGLMSGDWRNVADRETWRAVLATRVGTAWCVQVTLSLIAVLIWRRQGMARCRLLLLAGLMQWCGLAFTGHAAMLDGWPGAVQRANHALHLIAAALWSGGLPPLLMLMADIRQPARRTAAITTMMRFSRYGHLWVALTIITGTLNAGLILGWSLPEMGLYGGLLLVKVLLVMLMVAIAVINRYWLVPRFGQAENRAQRLFVGLTQLEVAIAALVVALVSFFATQSPG